MQAPSPIFKYLRASLSVVGANKVQLDYQIGSEAKSVLCQNDDDTEGTSNTLTAIEDCTAFESSDVIQIAHVEHTFIFCFVSERMVQCELRAQESAQLARRPNKDQKTQAPQKFTFFFDEPIPAYLKDLKNGISQSGDKHLLGILEVLKATAETVSLVHQHELMTTDTLSKLQTRDAMRRQLAHYLQEGNVALCMVHCSDFASINKKFGHDAGDRVIKQVADVIYQSTREADILCRFGGALFGIGFQTDSAKEAMGFAKKVHHLLHDQRYLDDSLELHFDIGVAHDMKVKHSDSASKSVTLLIKHAEQALGSAQQSKQAKIVCWDEEKFDVDEGQFQYFSGIFTPDNITNYRNMLLLWDISSIMADEYEFDKLFQQVVQRIASTIEFGFAGIIDIAGPSSIEQAYHVSELADLTPIDDKHLQQKDVLVKMSQQVSADNNVIESSSGDVLYVVIGLGNDTKKCFFMVGDIHYLKLTHDTKMLLAGFVSQLGKAMRRSILEEALTKQLAKQNEKLSHELETLKVGLQSSALVYRSEKMQRLMQHAERAALTDTTVLITGESGTGKEKLIHALHSLGDRSNQKLVIVDCGSIPETLIEAELFGHVKGAFTGAGAASTGKIKEADGGILVFDEIGELPLTMQPKLLRFVQEKHFTPVGATKQLRVDVKIIAVTNRDLAFEVEAGTFRKDLYYRLNVVSLKNPPLRERSEDIPLLVRHFLTKFSHQFDLPSKVLSQQAMQAIEHFTWPGNIRELENTLMQAVLLSKSEEITLLDLNLEPLKTESMSQKPITLAEHHIMNAQAEGLAIESAKQQKEASSILHNESSGFRSAIEEFHSTPVSRSSLENDVEHWKQSFQKQLMVVLEHIDNSVSVFDIPLGTCLEIELINLVRDAVSDAKTGASRLFIPASTYRRKLLKLDAALHQYDNRHTIDAWVNVSSLLAKVAKQDVLLIKPINEILQLLTFVLLSRYVGNLSRAALLLGVSEPTFYKMKKQVESSRLEAG